mmetsp:Transcript_7016/g.15522  ORF Transcript_7016/g.15522 Transcript_7016/m.15522 type:complete len:194 (+) Transcript_7016:91-672(+)
MKVAMSDAEVWDNRMIDAAAPMVAKEMVASAHEALDGEQNYEYFKASLNTVDADGLIEELLRFLALKVVIVGEPVPSPAVQDAWRKLMLAPGMYSNVCNAMGSQEMISYHIFEEGEDEAGMREDWYALTLTTYAAVWGEDPPLQWWPERLSWFAQKRNEVTRTVKKTADDVESKISSACSPCSSISAVCVDAS